MFSDEVEVVVLAGKGGNGCVSFRREKYVPYGGPDGGDGGKGGSVVLQAKDNTSTLYHLKGKRIFKAKNGQPGMGKNKTGGSGEDKIIKVPVGTIAIDSDTGDVLADMDENGKTVVIANGGAGGKGNVHFKTSTNQVPRKSTEGKVGDSLNVRLELKLIADVGLVGFPNAGKSTLITRLSNARPKIASYPFTTLVPNLGVVNYDYYRTYTIADIPGIIEGASDGVGLGFRFLKHIERTRLLLFMIDITEEDFIEKYKTLSMELENYSVNLSKKTRCIALNKIDLITEEEAEAKIKRLTNEEFIKNNKIDVFLISALSNLNLENLKNQLFYKISEESK